MFRKVLLASLITAACTLVVPTHLFGDTTTTPPTTQPAAHRHPFERLREALEQLNLSADQKTQIHQIIEDAVAQIKPIVEAARNGDREKARDQIQTIVKDTFEKVAAVLTEVQKKHLKEILHEERAAAAATTQK